MASFVVSSPQPFNLVSEIPTVSHLYLLSSLVSSSIFPVLFSVLTFQVPMEVIVFGSLIEYPVVDVSFPSRILSMDNAVVVYPGIGRSGIVVIRRH